MASEFIKDKSGIAVACGLPLPPAGKKTSHANTKRAAIWAIVQSWIDGTPEQNAEGGTRRAESGKTTKLPPFPMKVKSGAGKGLWRRADVVAWNDVRLGKHSTSNGRKGNAGDRSPGGKGDDLSSHSKDGELPPQANAPGAQDDLFVPRTPEEIRELQKRRLDRFEDIHLHPGERMNPMGTSFLTLNIRQEKELKLARPWLFQGGGEDASGESTPHPGPLPDRSGEGGGSGIERDGQANDPSSILHPPSSSDDDSPEIYGGQMGVANWINLTFQGRINSESGMVNAMAISRWLQCQYLPGGCKEAFPPPHGSGRFNKSKVRAWCERFIVRSGLPQSLPAVGPMMDAGEQLKAIQLKRELAEFEQWERSNSNRYMETEIVKSFIRGFGLWIAQQQDRFVEDRNGIRALVARVVGDVLGGGEWRVASGEKTEVADENRTDGPVPSPVARHPSLEGTLAAVDAKLVPLLQAANDGMKRAAVDRGQELMGQLVTERAEAVKEQEQKG